MGGHPQKKIFTKPLSEHTAWLTRPYALNMGRKPCQRESPSKAHCFHVSEDKGQLPTTMGIWLWRYTDRGTYLNLDPIRMSKRCLVPLLIHKKS